MHILAYNPATMERLWQALVLIVFVPLYLLWNLIRVFLAGLWKVLADIAVGVYRKIIDHLVGVAFVGILAGAAYFLHFFTTK